MAYCYIIETNCIESEPFILESHYALKNGDCFYAHGRIFAIEKLIFVSRPHNALSKISSDRVQIADCKVIKLVANRIDGFVYDSSQGSL
jgi:hypothetical protein